MNRFGFSLIEVTTTIGISIVLALVACKLVLIANDAYVRSQKGNFVDSEAAMSLDHVTHVGIKAKTCSASKSPSLLECEVLTPLLGVNKKRFVFRSVAADTHAKADHTHLDYEESSNLGISWSIVKSYGGISKFDLCADADMRDPNTNPINPCRDDKQWTPAQISLNYAIAFPAPQVPSRFFRVRVTAVKWGESGPGLSESLQSAFYVRNPTGINGLQYE